MNRSSTALILLGMLALTLLPNTAFALNLNNCAPGVAPGYITTRMVVCIQNSILTALNGYIEAFTNALGPTIAVLFSLGVILYAVKLLYQPRELQAMTFGFMLRFAIVGGLVFNVESLANYAFGIIGDLIRIVAGGYSPWIQLDIVVGRLLGFGSGGASLHSGLLGVLAASLFSGLPGVMTFLVGILAIGFTLYFVLRAVFIYLGGVMMLGFLLIIGPLIIPLALFSSTERSYFKKWLDLVIASIISPVVVVAFLSMFVGIIGIATNLSINAIHGNNGCNRAAVISGTCMPSTNFSPYTRTNTNMMSWLLPTDPRTWQAMTQQLGSPIPGQGGAHDTTPPVMSFMSPSLIASMDTNVLSTASLDFGPDQVLNMQLLTINFLGLFIVVYLMKSLLDSIPNLADSIAGVATGLGYQDIPLLGQLKQAGQFIKQAAGGGGGGTP